MGDRRGAYRILVEYIERKRSLGRPRRRRLYHIKVNLQEVEYGGMDWIGLAQDWDRWQVFVIVVLNLWVPLNAGNLLTS
jgi:hypothetical protein